MAQSPQNNNEDNVKVLSVVWYKVMPAKFGGQKAVAFFNEHLGQLLPLLCLCSRNNGAVNTSYAKHCQLPTNKFQFVNPFVWLKIYRFAKRYKPTHLILEFPYHGIAGFICKKLLGIKLIINTHNIEFLRFKEQKKWWWGMLYHFERWTFKNADAVLLKTSVEKEIAQKQFSLPENKFTVVPYGVIEAKSFSKPGAQEIIQGKHGIQPTEKILLFAGTLDYLPNAKAVTALKTQIIPLLNQSSFQYKIIVCGRNKSRQFDYLNKMDDPNLVFAGEVEDIDLYFNAADVFINPVIFGGGIQTKIMDALSWHLNVVCFNSKRAGILHADNKIFSVIDGNWIAFTSAIEEAVKLNEETPPAFFETYNWRTIAAKAYKRISTL